MNKKKIIGMVLILLICISLMYLLSQSTKINEQLMMEISELQYKLESTQSQYDDYIVEIDGVITSINTSLELKDAKYELLRIEHDNLTRDYNMQKIITETTKYKLSELGISDYSVVEEDLYLHPEYIGFEGILGGTMFFYKTRLLNDKLVYGEFEDGHINGYGIYKYDVKEDGNIEWQVITDFLFE